MSNNAGIGLDSYSIGAYLRRQRELRGISLEDVAAATHLPLRSLEQLESGSFDQDQTGFARGFVRTFAQAIGLDPEEAVTRMLVELEVPKDNSLARSRVRFAFFFGIVFVLALLGFVLSHFSKNFSDNSDDLSVSVRRVDPVRELAKESRAFDSIESKANQEDSSPAALNAR